MKSIKFLKSGKSAEDVAYHPAFDYAKDEIRLIGLPPKDVSLEIATVLVNAGNAEEVVEPTAEEEAAVLKAAEEESTVMSEEDALKAAEKMSNKKGKKNKR